MDILQRVIRYIAGLGYFVITDYLNASESSSSPQLVIWICTIGGLVSLFPALKAIKEEIKSRE